MEPLSRKSTSSPRYSLESFVKLSLYSWFPLTSTRGQYPYIKRIPNSTLLKKLPRKHHLKLKFKGTTSLEYLELRKLRLFSKKAFRYIKGLSLEYNGSYFEDGRGILKNKHVSIFASHMNRSLRRLEHLSIKLEFKADSPLRIQPLLKSFQQTFVGLVSLKLSFERIFSFAGKEASGFERLFARIGSTLKHLDLNFSQDSQTEKNFSEVFGMAILKNLHKLESICFNFNFRGTSAIIVRLLLWGACTHLTRLKSLNLSTHYFVIDEKDWKFPPKFNLKSNLQDLKLELPYSDLSLQFLSALQNDIVVLCPKLEELFLSTLYSQRFSNQFYSSLEKEFLQRLNLKKFRLHYSNDIENTWESFQDMQALELKQLMNMEEEIMSFKEKVGGEEEMLLVYQAEMEEEQAPKEDEIDEPEYLIEGRIEVEAEFGSQEVVEEEKSEYLIDDPNLEDGEYDYCFYEGQDYYLLQCQEQEEIQQQMEEEEFLDVVDAEIRFRDLTQGGLISEIYLDYGDS